MKLAYGSWKHVLFRHISPYTFDEIKKMWNSRSKTDNIEMNLKSFLLKNSLRYYF